jgi:hypothetical protein
MPSRGPLLLGALWLTAAVTATSVGLLAVHLVGNEVGAQVAAPLNDEGVQQALVSVSPTPTRSPRPSEEPADDTGSEGQARTVVTAGGVVSARCTGGRPTLLYATPAEGYRTERGTRTVVFVGARRQVTLTLTCAGDDLRTATSMQNVGTRSPSPAPVVQPSSHESPEHSEQPEPTSTDSSHGGELEQEQESSHH